MKSLYKDAKTNSQALFILAAFAMTGLSIYLTAHYFEVKFPTGLSSAGLCDINDFFNCDVATNSVMSNIAGVPIALFGILLGFFLLGGYLFKSDAVEGSNHFLIGLNFLGSTSLFIYSLIALGALCPFCTMYYIASSIAFFLFFKNSEIKRPDIKVLAIYSVIGAIATGITYANVQGKMKKNQDLARDLIKQFNELPNLGSPVINSEYLLASVDGGFEKAPIKITKFSDFQCPACKALSESLHKAAKKYRGKIAIQYFFYPLDPSCNPAIKRQRHESACFASYIAACLPEKFPEVEHHIFSHQKDLSISWLKKYAKDLGVEACAQDPKTKEKVTKYIEQSAPFNIKSTPSFLLNGVKIEGALPLSQLYILFDEILRSRGEK